MGSSHGSRRVACGCEPCDRETVNVHVVAAENYSSYTQPIRCLVCDNIFSPDVDGEGHPASGSACSCPFELDTETFADFVRDRTPRFFAAPQGGAEAWRRKGSASKAAVHDFLAQLCPGVLMQMEMEGFGIMTVLVWMDCRWLHLGVACKGAVSRVPLRLVRHIRIEAVKGLTPEECGARVYLEVNGGHDFIFFFDGGDTGLRDADYFSRCLHPSIVSVHELLNALDGGKSHGQYSLGDQAPLPLSAAQGFGELERVDELGVFRPTQSLSQVCSAGGPARDPVLLDHGDIEKRDEDDPTYWASMSLTGPSAVRCDLVKLTLLPGELERCCVKH